MALSPVAERRIVTFLPPLFVAALLIPFAVRQNAWYEWENAYWFLQRQAEHVSAHGVPTLFLHTKDGSFYPFFLYYGGFTIGLLAYPAALFGAWPVFLASMVAAVVGGYLGIWWTALSLGLSRRLAVLPALDLRDHALCPERRLRPRRLGGAGRRQRGGGHAGRLDGAAALRGPLSEARAGRPGRIGRGARRHAQRDAADDGGGAAAHRAGAAAVHRGRHGARRGARAPGSRRDRRRARRWPDGRVAGAEPLAGTQDLHLAGHAEPGRASSPRRRSCASPTSCRRGRSCPRSSRA